MKESCCQFGPDRQLAGIITEPGIPRGRSAVVLVSAGLVPKDGPFRLYTDLARRLSGAGFTTLRFDLSGIGESARSFGSEPLRKRTEHEIRAAVDYLTEHLGPEKVIVGGMCSGAEDSFRFAETDRRIGGVVMIDPFAYRTSGSRWREIRHRVGRRCARMLGFYQPNPGRGTSLVSHEYMAQDESTRILQAVSRRGVRVHFVYTGGGGVFNHEGQLQAMFKGIDFGGRVTVDHFPFLDRTQVLRPHRREMVDAIARRLAWASASRRSVDRADHAA